MKLWKSSTSHILTESTKELVFPKEDVALVAGAALTIPLALALYNSSLQKHPWGYKVAWVAAFTLNLFAVMQPGRFDGQVSQDGAPSLQWNTIFNPAAYAFAIWAVIYLGELLLTLSVGLGIMDQPVTAVLKEATPFWVAGNAFQSLWCYTFRPKFFPALWVPAALLGAACYSMFSAHSIVSRAILDVTSSWLAGTKENIFHFLVRFPLALHAGWLAAATLLNINGAAAAAGAALGNQIALAYLSSYMAFGAGAFLTYRSRDPCVALTVAWALRALAVKTQAGTVPDIGQAGREGLAVTQWGLAVMLVLLSVL